MAFDDKKISEIVKNGYNEVATTYIELQDTSLQDLEIFREFVSMINKSKKVLDLGCGAGNASMYFFEHSYDYIGVDISDKQIALAKSFYPDKNSHFILDNMLTFCKSQPSDSFDGIIALFSIFHLPRTTHEELFSEIKRILTNGSPILFTAFDSEDEGFEENWLHGNKPMFWSNHSYTWYSNLLNNLGFTIVKVFNRKVMFDETEENQYYLLFTKN